MSYRRILPITNILLLVIGYQQHCFDANSHQYRLSFIGVFQFIILTLLYIICFIQHFEVTPSLAILKEISPFLYGLVHIQLLLGCTMFIISFWDSKVVIRAANDFVKQLTSIACPYKFLRCDELITYFLLFSTPLLCIAYISYIAYEMEFKLPILEHALIGGALFIPHFVTAGALKFYNINNWLAYLSLRNHTDRVLGSMLMSPSKNDLGKNSSICSISLESNGLDSKELLMYRQQLLELGKNHTSLSKALQRQLVLLFILNSNCLLGGVYIFVYYYQTWYVMFQARPKRIFYAANSAIIVLICCDYCCFLFTQYLMDRARNAVVERLETTLSQRRQPLVKPMRTILKNIRSILQQHYRYKFFGTCRLNIPEFLHLHFLLAVVIAIIVGYDYINEQITAINVRLNGMNDE